MVLEKNTIPDSFQDDIKFLEQFFPNSPKLELNSQGLMMLAIGPSEFSEYKDATGKSVYDENTLTILAPNEAVLTFWRHVHGATDKQITEESNLTLDYFRYSKKCHIINRSKPTDPPAHILLYIGIKDITDKFSDLGITKGSMIPLKELKKHYGPGWYNGLLQGKEIKNVQICKSCNKKSLKGCCPDYSSKNRRVIKMVIGWKKV
jgi:hypothetical protein